ncbi:bacteriocin fulvocin C-related protein [Streptomyces sp. NPDC005374]|uniref:bacteriocin fulvocin C-related protein n=1 Tax=Streptomyces sp. NPDC005374 TaxID=3364713 RepID=UPI0036B89984
MTGHETRWVLAFDASCGTCRKVAATVEQSSRGRLEIVPLDRPEVVAWRAAALGEDAPWLPTLIKARGAQAHAWTGVRMGLPLTRRLGARGTVRVLRALGDLTARSDAGVRKAAHADAASPCPEESGVLPRKGFLRLVTGGVVAGALVLAGRTPALAADGRSEVREWLEQNKDALPTEYAAVTAQPLAIRKAIYGASAPEVKKALWLAHFDDYRKTRGVLTRDQRTAITQLEAFVRGSASLFTAPVASGDTHHQALDPLRTAAIEAFGQQEARALMAQLGPDSSQETLAGECGCALGDPSWCGRTCHSCCYFQLGCPSGCGCCCTLVSSGCGSLWEYTCDGLCY